MAELRGSLHGWVRILRYGGGNWGYVPGWSGLTGAIKDCAIRNDTLYVCGAFHENEGAPGNLIAAFNGTTWSDMGGGLVYAPIPQNGAALRLLSWHGNIYVCGLFNEAGGVLVQNRMAKWNGVQWCGLPGDLSPGSKMLEMAVWRDSLYVCGDILTADGQPARRIAQWIGGDAVENCSAPVGVNEVPSAATEPFRIVPNPSAGSIQLVLASGWQPTTVHITDVLGREVIALPLPADRIIELTGIAPGCYTVVVLDGPGRSMGTARFIKE